MQNNNILDDFDFEPLDDFSGEGEVVAKYFSMMEAEVAAARLRSEGIACFLANSTGSGVVPHLQTIIRLHVHPDAAANAREILADASQTLEDSDQTKGTNTFLWIFAVVIGLILAAMWASAKNMK